LKAIYLAKVELLIYQQTIQYLKEILVEELLKIYMCRLLLALQVMALPQLGKLFFQHQEPLPGLYLQVYFMSAWSALAEAEVVEHLLLTAVLAAVVAVWAGKIIFQLRQDRLSQL
jgi:hypothetical protein